LEYFGQPCFTHDENTLLYAQLNEEAAMLLADGANVIYDTSFNYYKDRQMMREIAARHGAKTLLIHVKTPEAVACRRATDGTNNQPTRVLGPMEAAHFARLSRSLEVPLPHEDTIKLDGEQITAEYIRAALWEAGIVTLGD